MARHAEVSYEEGESMIERENLKQMLKKLIIDTENDKIKSAEQMIETMIYELSDHDQQMSRHQKHMPDVMDS